MSGREPVEVAVAVGANLGDARATVLRAIGDLRALGQGGFRASSLWRTAPVQASGPEFVNAVCAFSTSLSAQSLLEALQKLEHSAGRERPFVNAPRTLDLDLIFYGSAQIHSPQLTVPHPRWRERGFVLWPLAQVMPQAVSADMLAAVRDQQAVEITP